MNGVRSRVDTIKNAVKCTGRYANGMGHSEWHDCPDPAHSHFPVRLCCSVFRSNAEWFIGFVLIRFQHVHWMHRKNAQQHRHVSAKHDTTPRRRCMALAWHQVSQWQSCRSSPIYCSKWCSKCASEYGFFCRFHLLLFIFDTNNRVFFGDYIYSNYVFLHVNHFSFRNTAVFHGIEFSSESNLIALKRSD